MVDTPIKTVAAKSVTTLQSQNRFVADTANYRKREQTAVLRAAVAEVEAVLVTSKGVGNVTSGYRRHGKRRLIMEMVARVKPDTPKP